MVAGNAPLAQADRAAVALTRAAASAMVRIVMVGRGMDARSI
jgi:hypothetical protein